MAKSLTSHRPTLAIALKLCAVFLFMVMAALVKATAQDVPPGQAVFFRSFCAIPVILGWLLVRGELRNGLVTKRPMIHFWRGTIGTSAMAMTFAGLGLLPLPEVTAIGYATPIFTVILAAIFLGERIRMIRITAVVLGMLGVMIMLWPRLGESAEMEEAAALGGALILLATLARALVQIQVRKMVETEHTAAIVFYFSATATILSLLTLPFGWVVPSAQTVLMLIMVGFLGGLAQILVTSAYRFGAASMLAPVDYASMLFAILIGYVWFSELPTSVMLLGASLVIAGNILVLWRERQLGLDRAETRDMNVPKN